MYRLAATNTVLRRLDTGGFVIQWFLVGCAVWMILTMLFLRPTIAAMRADTIAEAVTALESPESMVTTAEGRLNEIWTRNIRQVLIPPKPQKKPPPTPTRPPPPVKLPSLLATFVENGDAWGVFQLHGRAYRVRTVSQDIDGFKIVAIHPGSAQLTHGGKIHTVETAISDTRRIGKRSRRARS